MLCAHRRQIVSFRRLLSLSDAQEAVKLAKSPGTLRRKKGVSTGGFREGRDFISIESTVWRLTH